MSGVAFVCGHWFPWSVEADSAAPRHKPGLRGARPEMRLRTDPSAISMELPNKPPPSRRESITSPGGAGPLVGGPLDCTVASAGQEDGTLMAVMGDSNADLEKKIRQGRQRRD